MNVQKRIVESLLTLSAVLILFAVIIFLGANVYTSPQKASMVQLEDGWTVSDAQNTYYPNVLSEANTGIINKNDSISISHPVPDMDIDPLCVHFRSILSSVEVYLDNELIYSFGEDYVARGRMLPKMQHFVTIPNGSAGKTLKIVYTGQDNNAFSGLSVVTFGNPEDIVRNFPQSNRLPLSIGSFLIYFGFVLMVVSPFFFFKENPDYSINLSGVVSLLMGIYILTFNDLAWLFISQPAFYTFIEYFSLYMIPSAILGFLTAAKQIPSRTIGTVLWIVNLGFSLVTTVLHLLNIIHICHFVSGLHLIALLEGAFVIVSLVIMVVRKYRSSGGNLKQALSTTVLILGLLVYVICSVVDIIKYNIMKFAAGESITNIHFMTVGALIFTFCLVMNYFFHCIEYISESNIKHELEGLAYTDSLTGLSNRSKCEVELAELTGEYTVISIDLDYLKYTNDNYGHTEGDRLLSDFSSILKNSFTDASLLGRMGGDEFIVVLPYVDNARTSRSINCFNDLMSYRNSLESRLKFSASYGVANSKEADIEKNPSAQNVYLLADTRMYKMKNEHHKQSLGRLYDDLMGVMSKEGGVKQ